MRATILALFSALLFLFPPIAAVAQTEGRANTILVLDGSGSMWGQIDGVNKIVIARNVIADLLADMPDDMSLGLTAYGHRTRGDCSDIENIIAPAPFTQDAILEAVNGLNPRGRTPMTDAVVAAAQALRHTEDPATVILVSDGIETCEADPCAIAAELEASGIAFTAHVVGFDVNDPEARAQMQCIADNTGGLFLSAANADELADALDQVVMAPAPITVQFQAIIETTGALATRPITWQIAAADGTIVSQGATGPTLALDLVPGNYVASATRQEPAGPATYQTGFSVVDTSQGPVAVAMDPIIETVQVSYTARVLPNMTVPASPLVWTITDATGAALVSGLEAPSGVIDLLPGDYRIDVVRVSDGTSHFDTFTVAPQTPREVIVPLPALAYDITFTARIGAEDGPIIEDRIEWELTDFPAMLDAGNQYVLPLERGAYSMTAFWLAQEAEVTIDFVVVDAPREVVFVFDEPLPQATITAPATAVAGSTIEVGWTGPDNPDDYIGIGTVGAERSDQWENFTYTGRGGNPLSLLVPPRPGDYVIRYFLDVGSQSIAEVPISVTPAQATITAPATAVAGSTIEVGWTGPDYDDDYIGIGQVGAERSDQWENFTYTGRGGNPLSLLMPTTPGDYVIRYFLDQDRVAIAEVPITITEVAASITAPAQATAGSTIEIGWTGPDNPDDYIGIGQVGAERSDQWENFTYTGRGGNPLSLLMPTTPGDYVIRYFLDQDRVAIAEVPITITEVAASITAPAQATAGSTIEIGWTGPDNPDDYIGIGQVGAERNEQWENFTYTERGGNPLQLLVPGRPGTYLIRYFMDQGRRIIAEVPITVTPVTATLTAPPTIKAGETLEIGWTGPDYRNDYIGIGRVGAERNAQWEGFAYTATGNPVTITAPDTPGDYLIQYFMDQDRITIGSIPLTVE